MRGEIGKEDNDKNQHGRRGFPRKRKKSLGDHFDVIKENQTLKKPRPHTDTHNVLFPSFNENIKKKSISFSSVIKVTTATTGEKMEILDEEGKKCKSNLSHFLAPKQI